jgi:hypothetical protein
MKRMVAFPVVLALTGAALVIQKPRTFISMDFDMWLLGLAGIAAAMAGVATRRFWVMGRAMLVLAPFLTTALGGLIGGVLFLTALAMLPSLTDAPFHPPILQTLAMALMVPFLLMVETLWKIPVWLAGMGCAAWIMRGRMPLG